MQCRAQLKIYITLLAPQTLRFASDQPVLLCILRTCIYTWEILSCCFRRRHIGTTRPSDWGLRSLPPTWPTMWDSAPTGCLHTQVLKACTHILRKVGRCTQVWMINQPVLTIFFPLGNHRPIYLFHKGPAQKKWSNMTGMQTLLCHCVCWVQEKRVACFLCLQWTYTLLIGKHEMTSHRTVQPIWLHCECLRHMRRTTGLQHTSDPKGTVFLKYNWIIWL